MPRFLSFGVWFLFYFWVGQTTFSQDQIKPDLADLVIVNANVLVCNPQMSQANALAIRNGRIIAVGDRSEMKYLEDKAPKVIDAAGKTVTPGLIDSHLHFIGLGQSLQQLDLSEAKSWEDIVVQVERAAKLLPKGTWIEGRGWHQSKWSHVPEGAVDGYPNHRSMSAAVPDHPVVLSHASGHASFANEAAMDLAGVDRNTSDPAGGEVLKDSRGEPIGVFRENAQELIDRAQARSTQRMDNAQLRSIVGKQLQLAGQACLAHGITCVHDAGSSFATVRLLKQFAESGELPVRMSVMIRADSDELAIEMPRHRFENVNDGFLNVRSVKASSTAR